MTTEKLLSRLHDLNVRIWVEADKLRLSAARGVLTPELYDEVTQGKGDIIAFLRAADAANKVYGGPIQRVPRDGDMPLSFSQERIWFLEQLAPGSPIYNLPMGIRLNTQIDCAVLEKSLNEILRRHEALRATFYTVDGRPAQKFSPPARFHLAVVDLQRCLGTDRDVVAQQFATTEARLPFDLERGPLFRATLLKLADDDYTLLLTMHHIVSDGWSLGVLMRELNVIYAAFLEDKPSPLTELPIQYADYAYWQRQWLRGEVLDEQRTYWKERLSGSLPVLDLPADHPRPVVQTYQGASQTFALPASLLHSLTALSRQEDVTLFMTLLAAFNALLCRYTGQEDVVVGVPVANRDRTEIEGLVGMFVNTLVMRADLSGNPNFRELLARIREVAMGAFAHQSVPFEAVVEALNPTRETAYSPLFQVMFVFERAMFSPFGVDTGTARCDLTLFLWEQTDRLTGLIEYRTDLFEKETICRAIGHLQTILDAVVANPNLRISELPLLTYGDRQHLLMDWNNTETNYPQEQRVQQLFEAQAQRTPKQIAAVCGKRQLTYQELDQRANQLARHLRANGVVDDTLVGVYMERSLDMLVAILAVLKAGGAYVPLDPAYPKDRLAFMIEDTSMPILLTQQRLVARLPAQKARAICLDGEWRKISREKRDTLNIDASGDHLAYTIYTSGSTGRPKGVQITHRAVVNFLCSMLREPGITRADTLLSVTTLSFDIAGLELFLPLIAGARVVIASSGDITDGQRLLELLERSKATIMQATPITWRILLESGWKGNPKLQMLCGGEALSRDLADQLLARGGSLWNMYGPTETTIWSTIQQIVPGDSITVGKPIANTRVYILDVNMQPVPIGVHGSLYIGGAGLARGYLNQPALTAERFVPDPFSPIPGARMYKTGDLARYLPDGRIVHLGREDYQVKVRGYRIELEEIETTLRQHPAVQQAVVVVREDKPGDKRLVGYIVPDQERTPSIDELRAFLREQLPDYMVPPTYVFLESFPYTPNRKVDRRALPVPGTSDHHESRVYVAPRDVIEGQLARIWEEVLGVARVGVAENFFDLGGHSLLIVRLFDRIHKTFGQRIPIATLFQAPTVEELAKIISQQVTALSWPSLVAVQPGGSKPPFFCVHEFDGNVFYCEPLARHLGPDQPVYGLQAKGFDDPSQPYTRFEDIAAQYIRDIRTIQPVGPYHLGGSSLGGQIAFEMACQLCEQGQSVGLLALFDTWSMGYLKLLSFPLRDRISRHREGLSQLPSREWLQYIMERAKPRLNIASQLRHSSEVGWWRIMHLACYLYKRMRRPLPPSLLDFRIREMLIQAQADYTPRVYPGRVTFFQASEQPERYFHDPRLDKEGIAAAGFLYGKDLDDLWAKSSHLFWTTLAGGGIDVYVVPGPHGGIVREPYVGVLAERLSDCLQMKNQQTSDMCRGLRTFASIRT